MAKAKEEETALAAQAPMGLSVAAPDFMSSDGKMGLETTSQYVIPPRVKVVQDVKADERYDKYAGGDVLLVPQNLKIASAGETFYFTPVFFYPEYLVVNPIQMKGQLPVIRERSLDPRSEIAVKARDATTRKAPCPEKPEFDLRYVESLTFLSILHGVPGMEAIAVAMSFQRGEHRMGSQLCSLLNLRGAPPFGCIFAAKVPKEKRRNPQGAWYGIDVSNPDPASGQSPWVSKEAYDQLRKHHLDFKEKHEQSLIMVEYDDDAGADPASESEGKF